MPFIPLLFDARSQNFDSFRDFVNGEIVAIAPALSFRFNDDTNITLKYEYLNVDQGYYEGFSPDPRYFDLPISRNLGEPDNRYDRDLSTLNLTFNHQFNDNLRFRSGFAAQFSNESWAFVDNSDRLLPGTSLADRRFVSRPYYYSEIFSSQDDLVVNFETGAIEHQPLLGMEWNKLTIANRYRQDDDAPSLDIFDPEYERPFSPEFDLDRISDETRTNIGIYL